MATEEGGFSLAIAPGSATGDPDTIAAMASESDPGWAARLNFRQLPDNPSDLELRMHELNLRQLPGSGWTPIIDRLHRELIALDPGYVLHQVKEKFGTLRFYGEFREDVREVCEALVRSAEIESSRTCERCGAQAACEPSGAGT